MTTYLTCFGAFHLCGHCDRDRCCRPCCFCSQARCVSNDRCCCGESLVHRFDTCHCLGRGHDFLCLYHHHPCYAKSCHFSPLGNVTESFSLSGFFGHPGLLSCHAGVLPSRPMDVCCASCSPGYHCGLCYSCAYPPYLFNGDAFGDGHISLGLPTSQHHSYSYLNRRHLC